MSKKIDLWMPIYIGDYLSATTRLSTEQHGAYLLLIMDYWKHGSLPNDDRVLAQITRMTPDAWSNARSILEGFFEVTDKHWMHTRIEKELENAKINKDVATKRAKAGAEARWGNKNASSNAQAMPEQSLGDATSPSPSPSYKKDKKDIAQPDGVLDSVWQDFVKHRKQKKAAITETALKGIDREARKAGISLNDALQEICSRGWTGFKAEWVQPKENNLSFAERDELAKRKRWEEMTGRKWPEDDKPIDITPTFLEIEQ